VLIEGKKISAVAPDLSSAAHGAVVVDANGMNRADALANCTGERYLVLFNTIA
jgi:hypothetical protein